MSIDKNFTFTPTKTGAHINRAKVCKTAKEYKGACEHCSSDILKGTFALTADEVTTANRCYGVRTVKTHRLCARCTAEYIASTSTQPVDDIKGESMEFDKNKILTVVTADQAKVGSMGYFSNYIPMLKGYVTGGYSKTDKLIRVSLDTIYPFFDGYNYYSLFYPSPEPTYEERQAEWVVKNNVKVGTKVRFTKGFEENSDGSNCCEHRDVKGKEGCIKTIVKTCLFVLVDGYSYSYSWTVPFTALEVIKEPTYAERQAQWIKENNVKEGTKVRVARTFREDEDGSICWEHNDLVGKTGIIRNISSHNLGIDVNDRNVKAVPYFALEVIKEPTYRPFKNDELNSLVGKVLTQKGCGYPCLVTQRYSMTQVCVNGYLYNAQQLLELFALDGKPCGIKEEV